MDDNALQQRIKYLVEHGGLYDDPLAEIKRMARWAVGLSALAFALVVVQIIEAIVLR